MIHLSHFFQESRSIRRRAQEQSLPLRMVLNPSRVFQPRVVESVEEQEDRLEVRVNFEGLYGGLGVLPGYFSDEILHHRDQLNALQDFLDVFNHRLLDCLFQIWRSSQIFLENGVEATEEENREFDRFLRSLAGIPASEGDQPTYLKCLRRHHFSLFQRREKSILGLSNVLTSFFSDVDFEFEEHEERFIPIPAFQRAKMSADNPLTIGASGTMLIGTRIRDINGRFTIKVADLDYACYMRLLPGGDWHELLGEIVRAYTEDQWECGLKLELRADEIPTMKLGEHRMGANCWLLSGAASEPATVELGGGL